MWLTLTANYIQEVLDRLKKIGPTPTIDSRKSVSRQDIVLLHYHQPFAKFATSSSVPKDIQINILRHDHWYTKIIDNVFNASSRQNLQALDAGSMLLHWQTANPCATAQKDIQRILLHPHVPPYHVRAELGRNNWQSLYSRLATESLFPGNTPAPNVFGTYLLHGQSRLGSSELQKNMVYCSKAHAMNAACNAGLRRRMDTHRK